MAVFFLSNLLGIVGLIPGAAAVLSALSHLHTAPSELLLMLASTGAYLVGCVAFCMVLYAMEKKLNKRAVLISLMFPIFMATWIHVI